MAETSPGGSSLSLTIDKSVLECSICCGPFDDPRSLPCLHPFCCGCLENWAKTCSSDRKSLNCLLCKKVYRIPAEKGVKGFPAHFLVKDLQSSAEKANQKSLICEDHGEKKIYYCETCDCAACSDCTALDPAHRGHTFNRLKQVAEKRSRSLENLVRKVLKAEQKCKAAIIEQSKQLKVDLNKVAKEKIKAIEEVRDQYIQQGKGRNEGHMQRANELINTYRQEIYHKRKIQTGTIKQIEEKLCSDLTAIRDSCEQASNVAKSDSDTDIISLYPSLSLTLEQHARHQVPATDVTLSQIQIEAPQCETLDLVCIEQLLCNKLQIEAPNAKILAKDITSSSSWSSLLSWVWSALTWFFLIWSAFSLIFWHWSALSLFSWFWSAFSLFSWFKCTFGVQTKLKKWTLLKTIKIAQRVITPTCLAVHPNGDFAIAYFNAPVAVFSRAGNLKFIIKGSPLGIRSISVTPDHHYVIPGYGRGKKHTNMYTYMTYNSQGSLINTTSTFDINNKPGIPTSVAVDSKGRIIVGLGYNKTVSILQSVWSRTPIFKFKTAEHPLCVICAPDDRLVISFDDHTVRIMDQSGRNASIIQPPPDIVPWFPECVCCSKQGELLVTTSTHPIGFRYKFTGRTFKYQIGMLWEKVPVGSMIKFSADGKEMFVASNSKTIVHFKQTNVFET